MSRRPTPDLLPGTLDLLILRTLQTEPLHGWAISERIEQISQEVLQVNQGSLYPALHRLEHQGWIDAEWRVSDSRKAGEILPPDRIGAAPARGRVGRVGADGGGNRPRDETRMKRLCPDRC